MAVTDHDSVELRLKEISLKLKQRGQSDLADDVSRIAAELGRQERPEPSAGWLTTGEAARALGVRSINTVKRWAMQGLLDGVRRGGRLLVSEESISRLLRSPTVAEQQAREARVSEALDPFDAGTAAVPPTSTWAGHKPWTARERNSS